MPVEVQSSNVFSPGIFFGTIPADCSVEKYLGETPRCVTLYSPASLMNESTLGKKGEPSYDLYSSLVKGNVEVKHDLHDASSMF